MRFLRTARAPRPPSLGYTVRALVQVAMAVYEVDRQRRESRRTREEEPAAGVCAL